MFWLIFGALALLLVFAITPRQRYAPRRSARWFGVALIVAIVVLLMFVAGDWPL